MNVRSKVAEAFFYGIKAGKCPEQGEMGRPDMGGYKYRLRAGLQGDLQQVAAVQPQYRPAVGMDIPNGLQLFGKRFRSIQTGEKDDIVNLAGPAVFLVDGANLPRQHEPRLNLFPGDAVRLTEGIP